MSAPIVDHFRLEVDGFYGPPDEIFDVSKYPSFDFSMKDVKRAGAVIAGPLDASDPNIGQCVQAFKIANNWRDAHALPMKSIRASIRWHMKRTLGIQGVTAARLKRMQAIRRKLRRVGLNLSQLQDLGGCRAIVSTVEEVEAVVSVLRERSRHVLFKANDYIAEPKPKDGYRSHHLVFEYRGTGERAVFNDRRIEVQIRTDLQHSWATAVESVGLFRGEDLKGNKGDEQWLRLFKLMSAEFAAVEHCAEPAGVPSRRERIEEIVNLNSELQAAQTLENLSNAVQWTDDAIQTFGQPSYYLVLYDNKTLQVRVEPYFNPIRAVESYDRAENADNESGNNTTNVVLVEAGKIEQLKQAYPNYFGDVTNFKENLKRICSGKDASNYALVRQERVMQPRERRFDPAWLNRRGRWK